MKLITWILLIWVVGSCIYGKKNDSLFLAPFIRLYQDLFHDHTIATIIGTIVSILLLVGVLL